jgi:hypothetical protein
MVYLSKLAKRMSRIRLTLLPLGLVLSACSQGTSSDPLGMGPSISARLQSSQYTRISIRPRGGLVDLGKNLRLKAWAFGVNGDSSTASVTWSASGGTIKSDGTFSAKVAGTYVVKAVSPAPLSLTDTTTVTVRAGIARISVSPKSTSLLPKASKTMEAVATLTDSSQTIVNAQWSANGGTISSSGTYTAGSTEGSYWAAGTIKDATGRVFTDTAQVQIAVEAATLTRLVLSPSQASVAAGSTSQFDVSGTWSDGSTTVPTVTWSATGGTISTGGLYTAGSTTGTYRVIATQSGGSLADTSTVTITAPSTLAVSMSVPAGSSVTGGTGVTTKLVATVSGSNIAGVTFGIASGPGVSTPQDMPPEVTVASSTGKYEMNWSLDPSWTPAGSYVLFARVRAGTGETLTSATVPVQITRSTTTSSATLSVGSTSVQPGASVRVTFSGGSTTSDWVGLYASGAAITSDLDYRYLNGLKTVPSTVIASGSFDFPMPTTPGTYELRFVRDDIGGCNCRTALATSATITVLAPVAAPTVSFSASPTIISSGQSSTLSWTSSNATSCSASGGWSGSKSISGSLAVSPTASTTYTLACTGSNGTTTQSTTVSLSATGTLSGGGSVAIPQLALWQSNVLTYGAKAASYLAAHKNDSDYSLPLAATYYDAAQVFNQIARYTGDSKWYTAMADAVSIYRDRYVLPNNGTIPGYWNFTSGLRMDYERSGSSASRNGVVLLSQHAAYAADGTDLSWTAPLDHIREVTYAIRSYIEAEKVGEPRRARRADLVTQSYGHLSQFVDKTKWGTMQVSPFMAGLAAWVLIKDWEQTHDARLIPALQQLADFLWANAWVSSSEAMKYGLNANSTTDSSPIPSPDLNNLIAPMYGFLWAQTGDTKYRDEGDALFAGGAKYAYLDGNKQFDQNYEFSFDYVTWRSSR